MAEPRAKQDFRERYTRLLQTLQVERPGWIRDAHTLHLPACVLPWTEAGIELERGDQLTVLAAGGVIWSLDPHIVAGPRLHLWGQVGNEGIFRLGSDTLTLTATASGTLRLCICHGMWASPDGTLATSP